MPRFRIKGVLEHDALEDLWNRTLSRMPSRYARLAYLASLRDPNSGIYRHHGLAAMFGREGSGKALQASHERAFWEWLNLPMADKYRDLMLYLDTLEEPIEVVIEHWVRSKTYRTLTPGSARKVERELFVRDLQALLETIRNGWDAVRKDPASSRPE